MVVLPARPNTNEMKYLIGNWKMNPQSLDEALDLAKATDIKGTIICPPFVHLEEVAKILQHAELGAQDLFWKEEGTFTGEISAKQIKDLGVKYVIVGHSERRAQGESSADIAKKVQAAQEHDLVPILCVGETAIEKDEGKTIETLREQLEPVLFLINKEKPIIIAYEPVWSISSGDPAKSKIVAKPKEVEEAVDYIKKTIKTVTDKATIIYGGSTRAANLADYLAIKNVSGVLSGGASLQAEEFKKMAEIIN